MINTKVTFKHTIDASSVEAAYNQYTYNQILHKMNFQKYELNYMIFIQLPGKMSGNLMS